ncbi:MAG: hypothetical protein WD114_02975 [Phycisphaerales bacterium]
MADAPPRPYVRGRPRALLRPFLLHVFIGGFGCVCLIASFFYGLHHSSMGLLLMAIGFPCVAYGLTVCLRPVWAVKRVIRQDRHLPCPACLYPLHDLHDQPRLHTCPECGITTKGDEALAAWLLLGDTRRLLRDHPWQQNPTIDSPLN